MGFMMLEISLYHAFRDITEHSGRQGFGLPVCQRRHGLDEPEPTFYGCRMVTNYPVKLGDHLTGVFPVGSNEPFAGEAFCDPLKEHCYISIKQQPL